MDDVGSTAPQQASPSPVLLALAQVPQYVSSYSYSCYPLSPPCMVWCFCFFLQTRSLIGQKQQRIFPRGSSEKLLSLEGTEAETRRLEGFFSEQLAALSAQRVVAE